MFYYAIKDNLFNFFIKLQQKWLYYQKLHLLVESNYYKVQK